MRINAFDDGLRSELLEQAFYDGIFEIPRLEPLTDIIVPSGLVPFSKRKLARNRFVHYYEHEARYQKFTNHPELFLDELSQHPGIISPDNSILVEAPLCAQIANLFISRRNACFLQHNGIYQIPNVRWGDERTFTTVELPEPIAFAGIPHDSIVAIGTYGCCQTQDEKRLMHLGIIEMLKVLHPVVVVVYGPMQKNVFCDLPYEPKFIRFDNWDKEQHLLKNAGHDKLVKNWRNKHNSVQGECRDRPLAGWHDRTAAADAEGVQQLTPQKAACIQANCYLNNRPCSKTMRQARAGRRRERSSCSRRRNCRSFK